MNMFDQALKYIWQSGGILCLVVFVWRATPILLNALGEAALQGLALFLILFGLAILITWMFFFFAKQFVQFRDRQHYYRHRQKQREMNV